MNCYKHPKRDEVKVEWRRLHNKELYTLYPSPNIIRVIKSRRLRWARHVAHMWDRRGAHRVLEGKPEESRPLGRPGVDVRIILKWIFKKWDVTWIGSMWLRIGASGGLLRM
jgi:hypothetical protein